MVKRRIRHTKYMKKALKSLIAALVILLCGNLGVSQNKMPVENRLSLSSISNDIIWTESNRNIELRKNKEVPFFYPYDLPDAEQGALALFRTYSTPLNNGFAIIEADTASGNLITLAGRAKFSGSDIDQTKDTLIIATYYSKTKDSLLIANLHKGFIPDKAAVLKISEPLAQFEPFYIHLAASSNIEERKYLIVQFIIKSGSDDNYYYGISNAVIDNLHFNNGNAK